MRLRFHQTGHPPDVLRLEAHDSPAPGAGDVAVRMTFAPVHPADLNFIEGTYGTRPDLPAVPGNEGCGQVESIGPGVRSLAPGDSVIPLRPLGCWSQRVVAPEIQWLRIAPEIDPRQAAMLRVNPATAWHLLREFRSLQPGAVVAQNAANSAVGHAVVQLARDAGLRALCFARRAETFDELMALGADACFLDDDAGLAAAQAHCGDRPPELAINAVGGDSALRLMELLAPGGTHVTYGAMSRRSLRVPNRMLIFKDLEVRGAWITRRLERAGPGEAAAILQPLAQKMLEGRLRLPVEAVFDLADWRQAVVRALEGGRGGKILLRLTEPG